MNKIAFVDVGELTYSLYLSAHLRWLKKNTNDSLVVVTLPDRKCLYEDSADLILDVPWGFLEKFKSEQNCFGVRLTSRGELKGYFKKMIPTDYVIPENFYFNCNLDFLLNKTIYEPYKYNGKLEGKERILIFPRYRNHPAFSYANLPRTFYVELIEALCDVYPDREVKTIGLNIGSFNLNEIKKTNYINGVRESVNLQGLIDECQLAVAAIGGVSSLPRVSLLQGVPTFVVGIQKKRFTEDDNWLKTKVGFYEIIEIERGREIVKEYFDNFKFKECKDEIIEFLRK